VKDVHTERTTWTVTTSGTPALPPIVLIARTLPFHLHDFLTAEGARALGEALIWEANCADDEAARS